MDISKLSYEEAIKELENVLEKLEKNDSSLEETLEIFKKGMEIHKFCSETLSKTENQVKILLEKDEEIYEETFYSGEVD